MYVYYIGKRTHQDNTQAYSCLNSFDEYQEATFLIMKQFCEH